MNRYDGVHSLLRQTHSLNQLIRMFVQLGSEANSMKNKYSFVYCKIRNYLKNFDHNTVYKFLKHHTLVTKAVGLVGAGGAFILFLMVFKG